MKSDSSVSSSASSTNLLPSSSLYSSVSLKSRRDQVLFNTQARCQSSITSISTSSKLLLLCFFTLFSSAVGSIEIASISQQPNLQLLKCFEYQKNYWLVGQAFHTSSVQFKDECLRLCLSSVLRGSRCLSAMHIPGDDQCVISDQNQLTRPDLFVENDVGHAFTVNYFRNTCVDPPFNGGGHLTAHLKGFRGGQGLLEIVQTRGRNPLVMLIVTGLKENTIYEVIYAPTVELGSCFRAEFLKEHIEGRTLLSVHTDNTGMAVQPWQEIDFHILDDSVLRQTVLLVENNTTSVVDCGKLEIKGNLTDWEAAKNQAAINDFPNTVLYTLLLFVSALVLNS